MMYKVGDTLTLKHSHGILREGEKVQVVDVDKQPMSYYWLKVMSTERYGYIAYIYVCDGEEQDTV